MSGSTPTIGHDDLQALIDGRLPPERRAAVEAFLAGHPDVAARVAQEAAQREALRTRLEAKAAEPIPARLRIANIRMSRRQNAVRRLKPVALACLWLAVGGVAGWAANTYFASPSPSSATRVADAGIRAHRTFVVEVAHPVEVDASHRDHLLQWLSRRLGHPISAPDLERFGYHLMGGRLLPASAGAAAQLMYDDQQGSRLTLYVRTGETGETAFRFTREGDLSTFFWLDQGLGFAISAPTDRDQLLPIAEAVFHQLGDGSGAKNLRTN